MSNTLCLNTPLNHPPIPTSVNWADTEASRTPISAKLRCLPDRARRAACPAPRWIRPFQAAPPPACRQALGDGTATGRPPAAAAPAPGKRPRQTSYLAVHITIIRELVGRWLFCWYRQCNCIPCVDTLCMVPPAARVHPVQARLSCRTAAANTRIVGETVSAHKLPYCSCCPLLRITWRWRCSVPTSRYLVSQPRPSAPQEPVMRNHTTAFVAALPCLQASMHHTYTTHTPSVVGLGMGIVSSILAVFFLYRLDTPTPRKIRTDHELASPKRRSSVGLLVWTSRPSPSWSVCRLARSDHAGATHKPRPVGVPTPALLYVGRLGSTLLSCNASHKSRSISWHFHIRSGVPSKVPNATLFGL